MEISLGFEKIRVFEEILVVIQRPYKRWGQLRRHRAMRHLVVRTEVCKDDRILGNEVTLDLYMMFEIEKRRRYRRERTVSSKVMA